MILNKDLTFYHGSYTEVKSIDLDKSESGKDFMLQQITNRLKDLSNHQ